MGTAKLQASRPYPVTDLAADHAPVASTEFRVPNADPFTHLFPGGTFYVYRLPAILGHCNNLASRVSVKESCFPDVSRRYHLVQDPTLGQRYKPVLDGQTDADVVGCTSHPFRITEKGSDSS